MAIDREKILQTAQNLVEKKKYDKAIVEYRKLVALDAGDVRTLLKIGDLHLKLDQFEGAITTYEQVGDYYFREGFAVKAIAVYKQIRGIITRHTPHLETRYGHILPKLAEIYTQLGLTSDALQAYDEVATKLRQEGRERDALDVFKKVVALDPENPIAKIRVADSRVRLGDVEKAAEAFAEAAEIMLRLGRHDDAIKVLERLLEHQPSPEYARLCGRTYLERGGPNDGLTALSKLQIAFKADPRDLETLDVLARAFDSINQPRKALEVIKEAARIAQASGDEEAFERLLEELRQRAPDDSQVLQYIGHGAASEEKSDSIAIDDALVAPLDAIEEVLELTESELETVGIERWTESEPVPLDLALVSYDVESGGVDRALRAGGHGIHGDGPRIGELADPVVLLQNPVSAGPVATPFESLSGGIVERALEECELLSDLGRFAEARAIVRRQLENLPNHPLLLEALRRIEAMAGPEVAAPLPEEYVEEPPHSWANLDPSTYQHYVTGGYPAVPDSGSFPGRDSAVPSRAAASPGQAPPSEAHEPRAPQPVPTAPAGRPGLAQVAGDDARANYDLGIAYMEMGQHAEAIAALSIAARDPQRECVCLSMIGTIYMELGDLDSALAMLHQALAAPVRTREQDLAIGYEIGNAYEHKGMPEQALHFFEWLTLIVPNHPDPRGSVHERIHRLRTGSGPQALPGAAQHYQATGSGPQGRGH